MACPSRGIPELLTVLADTGSSLAVATSKPSTSPTASWATGRLGRVSRRCGRRVAPTVARHTKADVVGAVLADPAAGIRARRAVMVGDRHHDVRRRPRPTDVATVGGALGLRRAR